MDIENHKTWKLYILCRDQIRLSSMGDVIGLDHNAVIRILELYDEGQQMFEDILLCWEIEQELREL